MPYGMEYLLCPPDSRDNSTQANTDGQVTRIDTPIVNTGTVLRYQVSASQAFSISNAAQSANVTDTNQTLNLLITHRTHYVIRGYLNFYILDGATGQYDFLDQVSYDYDVITNPFGLNKTVIIYFYATGDSACAGFSTYINVNHPMRSQLLPLFPLPDDDPAPSPFNDTSTDPDSPDPPELPDQDQNQTGSSNSDQEVPSPSENTTSPEPPSANTTDPGDNESSNTNRTESDLTKYSILCMVLALMIGIIIVLLVFFAITLLRR